MSIRAWTRCVCTLAVMMAMSVAAGPAGAAVVDRLIVFGDSLSDTGNIHLATGGTLPGPAYFDGRFSNGPVWVEHAAASLGIAAPAPSLLGGTNFAFAGGSTGAGNSAVGSPNLQTQVGMYLGSGITPTDNDLFVIWAGANDFLIDGEDTPSEVVTRLMTSIQTLAASGAKQILVANLPDLTKIPNADLPPTIFVPTPGNLATRTAGYNTLLAAALDDFAAANAGAGVDLIQYDVAGFLDSILADPAAFGFTNVTDPAFNAATNTVVPNPDEYLFWDTVHISARTHQLLAQDVLSSIIPEPTTAFLLIGATTAALLRRPRRVRSADQ